VLTILRKPDNIAYLSEDKLPKLKKPGLLEPIQGTRPPMQDIKPIDVKITRQQPP
jgi:hypothetical protein